jgi:hypothetical protein
MQKPWLARQRSIPVIDQRQSCLHPLHVICKFIICLNDFSPDEFNKFRYRRSCKIKISSYAVI